MTATTTLRVLALTLVVVAAAGCGSSAGRPDGGDVGDADLPDASPFGTSCTTSSECPGNGYCVVGYGGHVCTYSCDAGCPQTWDCRVTSVDGSLESVCVPPDFELCTPCTADSQCGGGVCVSLGGDAFCLPSCPFEGNCPTGYACGADPSGQHPGQYCVPTTRNCSCTSGADEGQVRTCRTMNPFGACQGLETCRPDQGGWIGCDARAASAEACDGTDNDCDQLIDDGLSNTTCTNTVAGIGSCPGVTLCTGVAGTICQGPMPQVESCNFADDDCDGNADETFAGIGTVCSAGAGGCQRFGVNRCTSAGTGIECSAVAGTPNPELCNALDDNCEGTIDETFPTKGDPCSAGVGICARQGNQICSTNGATTVCSVQPGPPNANEQCNALDDDCDGRSDEGFVDPFTLQYNQDTACGSCAVDCTVLFGLANATGDCVTGGTPSCAMVCNPNAFNLDAAVANGCELLLDADAIYVSIDDAAAADDASCGLGPVGTGAGNHPCRTIAQGTSRATALNRTRVLVANGIYTEAVTLANGRSLLGGYASDTWQRDVASTGTLLLGVSSSGNHDRTVVASNITSTTVFEGFAVFGSANAKVGGNSYAIYVSGANANLTIRNNVVFGGRGGPGSAGAIGTDGTDGSNGQGRNQNLASDVAYDAHDASGAGACNASNNRWYSNGGTNSCGGDDVSGGSGGGNQCPAAAGAGCTATSCTFITATSINGIDGQPGAGPAGGGAGTGAARGDDMIAGPLVTTPPPMPQSFYPCYIPGGVTYGRDGNNGTRGAHGSSGPGCSAPGGAVIGGNWVGGGAGAGSSAGNGGGGGGGGAGGGAKCQNCSTGTDKLGGHGGGGGAGGCGGVAGGGATAGGGAFGIFIVGTAAAPVVTGNSVFRGGGGTGGVGGAGGEGGAGGAGAFGGTTGSPVTFCSDVAGRGANGGDGGHGSGGGGGCGGSSFGIFTSGLGSPNYCQAAALNTFSGGGGGAGGPGGYSIINPGGAGIAGALLDCSFQ